MPLVNDDEEEPSSEQQARPAECSRNTARLLAPVDPEPHMSSQFYTFNRASHRLMVRCLMAPRHPTPDEVRNVATAQVLASWRGVWKDRHEDTAYLTGWRRIQDKLLAQVDDLGNEVLFFKNNPYQFVPFIEQWGGIVQQFHVGPDLKHHGLKETLERMREVWTVGAKLYGVPESYVKVCISTCPACGSGEILLENKINQQQQEEEETIQASSSRIQAAAAAAAAQQQSRRKRFEYTESFEVSARDVPQRLQLLADKYKVVLCIRQKYIRYKPFLAEVKDYCCHRGGEPTGRKLGVLKRKRYLSKRCGCSFRIRAIVPITNYDEKEKTFAYQEDGVATFKLYAVHSGHEPGPHEGSARIIHRFVDPAGVSAPSSSSSCSSAAAAEDCARQEVLRGIRELRLQLGVLEQRLGTAPPELLSCVYRDVSAGLGRLRRIESLPSGPALDSSSAAAPRCPGKLPGESGFGSVVSSSSSQGLQCSGPASGDGTMRDPGIHVASSGKRLCPRCSREVLQEGPGFCRVCESLLRGSSGSEEGSLELGGYCTENDKWYEGVACGLDAASHGVELGFGHAIS